MDLQIQHGELKQEAERGRATAAEIQPSYGIEGRKITTEMTYAYNQSRKKSQNSLLIPISHVVRF